MRERILTLCTVLLLCTLPLAQAEPKWHTQKSTHFIVYYKNANDNFIRKVSERSESYYNDIADDLGFRRLDFWLWDKRANIYIYDDAKDYQEATGQPAWAGGSAIAQTKTIQTFPDAEGFLDTILPHELGHIIFREFVGFQNPAVPLWLEEAVASHQEKTKYSAADDIVRDALDNGTFMNLEKLGSFDLRSAGDKKIVELFYCEAFSVLDFLIKKFGKDNFVLFCQRLRDGKNLKKAIAFVYPYNNLEELDRAWQKYLQR